MSKPSSHSKVFVRSLEEKTGELLTAFVRKTGTPGFVLVAQVGAPLLLLKGCWGQRYAPREVEVLEGATFDEHSPTWHTLTFTAQIGNRRVRQEIVLHRINRVIESSQGDPPLFQLPYEHEGSGTLGLMLLGILPMALSAIPGVPIYTGRRLYFKALETAARTHGLDAAKYALAQAIAPHVAADVQELLLEALRARQIAEDSEPSTIIGGMEAFATLLRSAQRIELPRISSSDLPDYEWWCNGRLVATAIWNPNGKDNAALTDYLIEPAEGVFEWSLPAPTMTSWDVGVLLGCFSSAKSLP